MKLTSWDREIESRLRGRRVRYTIGRRTVVAALSASEGPRSAAELHDELGPSVPLSSLYRTLSVLETAEIVVPHHGKKGVTRYELAEWISGHHHHVICVDCGAVDDIEVPLRFEAQLGEVIDAIGALAAFTPTSHAIEIEGRCVRCT